MGYVDVLIEAMDDFYTALGRRIAARRRAEGLTQEAASSAAGIVTSYLAHIEAGRKKPTLDTLRKIAAALAVEAWQLLTDERASAADKLWSARERKLAEKVHRLSRGDLELLIAMAAKLGDKQKR
jgi:transcriptional regulator with XRE-family HTH domain